MRTTFGAAGLVLMLSSGLVCRAADDPQTVVSDYEAKLDHIAREILQIREELEHLVGGIVAQEMGRVFVFIDAPAAERVREGVVLKVDGKLVFSRGFTPAERALLDRGLPVEIADLRLAAGAHRVVLHGLEESATAATTLDVESGGLISWVAAWGEAGLSWRVE